MAFKNFLTKSFIINILLLLCSARPQDGGETAGAYLRDSGETRGPKLNSRTFLAEDSRHWPNGVVTYVIEDGFTEEQTAHILESFNKISEVSCVRWVNGADEPAKHMVAIQPNTTDPNVCVSFIGVQSEGNTLMSLGENCFAWPGAVVHEMMHAMGFIHEHQREDRNCYVRVDANEIKNNSVNYEIFTIMPVNYGFPYDINSVMHYSTDSIQGIHGSLPTYTGELSELDIMKIKNLYCDGPSYCEAKPEDCKEEQQVMTCPDEFQAPPYEENGQ